MDPRIKELAHNLINYSCSLQPKEKVMIHVFGTSAYPLAKQLVKEFKKENDIFSSVNIFA